MMIRKISKLDNFGVYQNFKWPEPTEEFKRFNLLFGWNGSGKSTLASFFYSLSKRRPSTLFPNGTFKIALDVDGKSEFQTRLDSVSNILVFNSEFIRENIDWNSVVKSLLLVDEKKIEERKELEGLTAAFENEKDNYSRLMQRNEELRTQVDSITVNSARTIKTHFNNLRLSGTDYTYYDKRDFIQTVGQYRSEIEAGELTLDKVKEEELLGVISSPLLRPISFSAIQKDKALLHRTIEESFSLLCKTATSKAIKYLQDNPTLMSWVERGFELHRHSGSSTCEFCGSVLKEERMQQLDDHFSRAYRDFKSDLTKNLTSLDFLKITSQAPSFETLLYPDLVSEFERIKQKLELAIKEYNEKIEFICSLIREKINDPHREIANDSHIELGLLNEIDELQTELQRIVASHNQRSNDYESAIKKACRILELHYVSTESNHHEYLKKQQELDSVKDKRVEIERNIEDLQSKIEAVERSLLNEKLGESEFNKLLWKFLARTDLSIKFNPELKGYEILRNSRQPVKQGLSEGEKTAIAFVYFVTKAKEKDIDLSDTTVVIDDPISSFDSNNLFHAFAFIKSNFKAVKQLFVLTHNFTFFKLIRDWFKPNKKNSRFYEISVSTENPRTSLINNATELLISYQSEYHYLFSRLRRISKQENLGVDDVFLASNLGRKVLESFLAFKLPKHRSNFKALLDAAFTESTELTDVAKERIYKFTNQYSHLEVIETDASFSENVVAEYSDVINEIFNLIKLLDQNHYDEMCEISN